MQTRRIRLTGALVALFMLLGLGLAGAALATVTESQITSPADESYFLSETPGAAAEVTITGTVKAAPANEPGSVAILCYAAGGASAEVAEIEAGELKEVVAGEYSFSVKAPVVELGEAPCVLRAVPALSTLSLPPGTPSAFEGRQVADSEFILIKDAGDSTVNDYSIEGRSFSSVFEIEGAGACGLGPMRLVSSPTLSEGAELFHCAAALPGPPTAPTRSSIQVDGRNAYDPYSADTLWNSLKPSNSPPAMAVKTPLAFGKANGLKTLSETDPLVICEGKKVEYPETKESCEKFGPAGITLERTWTVSDGGRLIAMRDEWISTDAKAHSVDAVYKQELGSDETSPGTYRFPGGADLFATSKTGQSLGLATGQGAILYRQDGAAEEAPGGAHPVGAIVFDTTPSGSVQVTAGSAETNGVNGLRMPYSFEVPAGGSHKLTMAFAAGYTFAEVCKLAEEAKSGCQPSVAITSPLAGPRTSASSVNVEGTASDLGGLELKSLTVNGHLVSGTGGKWKTTVPLSPGANPITAIATSHAGLTRTSTVTVNKLTAEEEAAAKKKAEEEAAARKTSEEAAAAAKKKAEEAAAPHPALATWVGATKLVKGNITIVLACNGPAGTSCSVRATLTTVEKLRGGRPIALAAGSRTVTVGSATASIPAGSKLPITIRLNATGRALLAHFHRLPLRLAVLQSGVPAAQASVLGQRLTLTVKHH